MSQQGEQTGELIAGRYEVVSQIGAGAQGKTFLARRTADDELVALKELDFARATQWQAIELFQREAQVLGGLDHPAIPDFIETFEIEAEDETRLFIAQEFVPGSNLQQRLDAGDLFDEAAIIEIAEQVLGILSYLHEHSPAVLHRDVKPANLISRPDGRIALVDFGAVASRSRGSTIVGTTGYMPPEQLMGLAAPESDLYALGATLVHLLTRRHPNDLVDEELQIRWQSHASVTPGFQEWLRQLVEPMPEDRPRSAAAALRLLHHRRSEEVALTTQSAGMTKRHTFRSVALNTGPTEFSLAVRRPQNPRAFAALVAVPMWVFVVIMFLMNPWHGFIICGVTVIILLVTLLTQQHSVVSMRGDKSGIVVRTNTVRGEATHRIPLARVRGVDVVSTNNGGQTLAIYADGKRFDVFGKSTRGEARQIADILNSWLGQARM